MDSLTFLEQAARSEMQSVYVVHGDEDFLRRQVLAALRKLVLGPDEEASFGLSSYPGDKAVWATVHDELNTLPFLCPRRLVVLEQADPFVTAHRPQLEKYVQAPSKSGVLVLEVKTWPATTRLYRLLDGPSSISCKSLTGAKLTDWCRRWSQTQHGKQLTAPAGQLLVELVGPEMGLLSQEIAKLAVYVGEGARIDAGDVDLLVGQNRAEETFKIFNLIAEGDAAGALTHLDRLLGQGERPIGLLGAFGWWLRRLVQATRLSGRGVPLPAAVSQVGLFKEQLAQQLLRHLGRRRLDRLYDWLVETDLGLKGETQLPERVQLERLLIRLAVKNPTPQR
jgi:DNA polymerase III subunit delta